MTSKRESVVDLIQKIVRRDVRGEPRAVRFLVDGKEIASVSEAGRFLQKSSEHEPTEMCRLELKRWMAEEGEEELFRQVESLGFSYHGWSYVNGAHSWSFLVKQSSHFDAHLFYRTDLGFFHTHASYCDLAGDDLERGFKIFSNPNGALLDMAKSMRIRLERHAERAQKLLDEIDSITNRDDGAG